MIVLAAGSLPPVAIRVTEPWTVGSQLAGLALASLVVAGLWRLFRDDGSE